MCVYFVLSLVSLRIIRLQNMGLSCVSHRHLHRHCAIAISSNLFHNIFTSFTKSTFCINHFLFAYFLMSFPDSKEKRKNLTQHTQKKIKRQNRFELTKQIIVYEWNKEAWVAMMVEEKASGEHYLLF